MDSFSRRLKVFRRARGLSQLALSRKLQMGQSTIANYEGGKRMPSVKVLLKIAKILDMPLNQLVTVEEIGKDIEDAMIIDDANIESSKVDHEQERKVLFNHLMTANMSNVIQYMMALSEKQLPLASLYDGIFTPTLYRVGALWASGDMAVFQEHFISSAIEKCIQYLNHDRQHKYFERAPVFMGVLAPKESHDLGLKMMVSHLFIEGWTTYDLGGDLAGDKIIEALLFWPTDILGFSCTMVEHLQGLTEVIESIWRVPDLSDQKILLCGQALLSPEADALKQRVSAFAFTIEEAMVKINELVR